MVLADQELTVQLRDRGAPGAALKKYLDQVAGLQVGREHDELIPSRRVVWSAYLRRDQNRRSDEKNPLYRDLLAIQGPTLSQDVYQVRSMLAE